MIERLLRMVVAIAGLTAVVLTIVVGRFDIGRDRSENIAHFVNQYRQADRIVQREIVNTRIGLSPSYDRMNAAMYDADRATGRLLASVREDAELAAATERLRRRVGARNEQIERYKTDNALLQNALARFSSLSTGSLELPQVGALSSVILRLAIENSSTASDEARHVLRTAETSGRLPPVVVAQARLLANLLPSVRYQIVALRLARPETDLQRIDQLIVQRTRELREQQSSMYLALLASMLLAAFGMILLVSRQVDRVRVLRRKSAGERLSGAVARLLLTADGLPLNDHLGKALERVAHHAATPLVFLALSTDDEDRYLSWPQRPSEDIAIFERLVSVARHSPDWRDDALVCPWLVGASGLDRLLLLRQGESVKAVLGIMLAAGKKTVDPDVTTAAKLALAAIIQAAAREMVEAQRIELERQLADAQRMKTIGLIASGVAHNFNNIIAAIGGFAEMAQGRVRRGSAVAGHLEEIVSAVGRARALVDDVLGYAGSKTPPKERIRLVELLAETMRLLDVSYGDEVAVRFQVTADPEVVGIPSRLQQVFMNICNNAEATVPGNASIGIGLRIEKLGRPQQFSHARLPSDSYAVVTISDNGPGIPPAVLPRLFEPFFTTRPSGTGLGLSTAWQIVSNHGGTIEVATGGDGSRFEIWLPLARGPDDVLRHGNGERILLLAPDQRAAEYEEQIAKLGYEPVFLRYDALEAGFDAAVRNVDAIVALDPPARVAAFLDRHAISRVPIVSVPPNGYQLVDLPKVLSRVGDRLANERHTAPVSSSIRSDRPAP